ncbi:MAG: YdcF family protein [Bradyrhizobium sp.]|uniref:YdcF family protein n=1 Tax=Bradyrhizobium sp. TaxID=376 RepID=UPI0025C0F765|nr:YdcF family protein [Bradyrhizobium sp.]MBI5261590.1 YdcF family protein [Bradyrhizobium sp.]
MFFALSKTIGIALLPVNFLIELGIIGLVLLATRFAALGRKLVAAAIALLALIAFSPIGNWLLYPLEARFPAWDASRGAPDGIIVLGGPIDADLSAVHHTPVVRSGADRIFAAAILARRYPNARVVFTGGSANLISNDAKEADYGGEILENLGVAKERITMERRSRNTHENAEFTKAMVAPKPGERWLLVTSAYHMPRSVGLFRKAGFAVEAYPVDWRVGGREDVYEFNKYGADGLVRTDIGVREWLGLIAYRLAGRIDELLPGPAKD